MVNFHSCFHNVKRTWCARNENFFIFLEILSYGSDFRIWFNLAFADPAVSSNFTNFMFDIEGKRYVISTLHQIVHIVFTYSHKDESRCYINGKYVNWDSYSAIFPSVSHTNHSVSPFANHSVSPSFNHSVSPSANHSVSSSANHSVSPSVNRFFPQMERMFSVSTPVNKYFNLTELFLWSSEMTLKQVLEEYHGNYSIMLIVLFVLIILHAVHFHSSKSFVLFS